MAHNEARQKFQKGEYVMVTGLVDEGKIGEVTAIGKTRLGFSYRLKFKEHSELLWYLGCYLATVETGALIELAR